jgi:hypothetical protein
MGKQIQIWKIERSRRDDVREAPIAAPPPSLAAERERMVRSMRNLIAFIEETLAENAENVVRNFVRHGDE